MLHTETSPLDLVLPIIAFYGAIFLMIIVQYVVLAIFLSKVLVKTGNEGWPAWVPIYSSWRVIEIAGYPGWIAALGLVPFANIVVMVYLIMAVHRINTGFGKSAGWTVLYIFLPLIWGAYLGYGRTEPWRGAAAWEVPAYPYGYAPAPQMPPAYAPALPVTPAAPPAAPPQGD